MVRRQQAADRAVRRAMRSPGAPPHQREAERLFWIEIAKGLLPAAAAIAVGASQPVGQRWFHNAGGMAPFDLNPLSALAHALNTRPRKTLGWKTPAEAFNAHLLGF